MPTFNYNLNIPNPPNNPSTDVPLMQINTNSINSIIAVNHYTFNDEFQRDGKHSYVQMPVLIPIPPGLVANEAVLYAKKAQGTSNFFITNGTSGNEFQLTAMNNTHFPIFGTNTNYPPAIVNQVGGWTFLPGGLLFQYGTMKSTGAVTTVVFPRAFSTVYSISAMRAQNNSSNTSNGYTVLSNTGFDFNANSDSVGIQFRWMAIGAA